MFPAVFNNTMAQNDDYFRQFFRIREDIYDLSIASCYCTGYLQHFKKVSPIISSFFSFV